VSFAVLPVWAALLLMAAAGAAAVVLFRLKVRPPRVAVPSLVLWRRVLDATRELTWWERVRRAVSLVATAAIAVAIALAVARPGPRLGAASAGRTLIVLDSSWSMLAESSLGGTRWDRAVALARRLAAAAAEGEVAVATTAEGLVEGPTTDLALVETALLQIEPTGGEGGAWPKVAGADAVHFVTDGALSRSLDPGVVVHSVFDAADNVAITAFGAGGATTDRSPAEAYLEVANYSAASQRARLVVSRGTTTVLDQPVDLAAGEAVRQVVPLAGGSGGRVMARVTAPRNALAIDDEAVAWIPGAEVLNVTVVSTDPSALALLFEREASVRATFTSPAAYRAGREDVVIFDRFLPADAPRRPALVIAPGATSWIGERGPEETNPQWAPASRHPVLDGVDLLTLDVKRARPVTGPGLTPIARSQKGTPLVQVVDDADRRYVVVAFAVADSNLPYAQAFPVLIANALEWLARPHYGMLARPGIATLPATVSRVTAPDGSAVAVSAAGGRTSAIVTRPGLYLVEAGGSRGVLGLNVSDPEMSNLARTHVPGSGSSEGEDAGAGLPWWMLAVALAFSLMAIEWLTWQRRITV
jgi:hypothetical protein